METPQKNWHVVYTKPRAEKKTATRLNAIGIEAYCPTVKEIRVWSDRKKKVDKPVLPSMIFVKLEEANRHLVFDVGSVVRYLFWQKIPAVVTEKEIEALRESLSSESAYKKVDFETSKIGKKIDLTAYGFKNEEGTIKSVKGNKCWIVLERLGFIIKLEA
ncbi:MAG: UpxY family transcription antiterminator [Psychroflexus sp.]|nr:UpxY family transcription antiterminator [Psychroflexus sp.]MDN6310648.1 UpxY family transcription antiterminator [Psychroflexus sp.]